MGTLRERARELAAVEVLLEHCGGVLVVEGRAGIGKTSLVEVACSRADELGYEVVRARGSELEAGFAFGVVLQLFERLLVTAGADEREALLADQLPRCGRCCPANLLRRPLMTVRSRCCMVFTG